MTKKVKYMYTKCYINIHFCKVKIMFIPEPTTLSPICPPCVQRGREEEKETHKYKII